MENHKAIDAYLEIQLDINMGLNLNRHLIDVNESIKEIDALIEIAESKNENIDGYLKLKNEVYFLKWQILEKLP
jgi:hypothetical protein